MPIITAIITAIITGALLFFCLENVLFEESGVPHSGQNKASCSSGVPQTGQTAGPEIGFAMETGSGGGVCIETVCFCPHSGQKTESS